MARRMTDDLDTYIHGHHESVVAQHRKRTTSEAAAFLLPHLRPGMRLLEGIDVELETPVALAAEAGVRVRPRHSP